MLRSSFYGRGEQKARREVACATEQIIASDRTSIHTLDSSTEFEVQTGPQLMKLALIHNTLSWNAHGSPTSAQLTP